MPDRFLSFIHALVTYASELKEDHDKRASHTE